ncbi:MAG: DUF839 domain-containing protein [Rhodanobacteraceae bacterium]|nr:DUF839 domain-containing protein [Xanthomonadales bacterium]MCP5477885.1 DUF839 domain-containing protein [Rhodanobacteraceae bacterium]HPF73720.1 DUF839 domain-containing protein [Xanthomonadaceae bacterium]HRY00399.1 DUF839 domain-containing protein [Xanthomonadaceae bacterium]
MTIDSKGRPVTPARRRFLGAAGAALGGLSPLGQLLAAAGDAGKVKPAGRARGYGPLKPARDENTGLPLLLLPEGFRYRSFGWVGDPLVDGSLMPASHDGMGIVAVNGSRVTLVRNHEVTRIGPAFGKPEFQYDPNAQGGTVTLDYDCDSGKLMSAHASLAGTMNNCAGGVTTWNSWLSCEEFVSAAGKTVMTKTGIGRLERDHGFVFEVPASGHSNAQPIRDMGQFRHEAAVVFPPSGDVYLTEDLEPVAGFYRFVPKTPGKLSDGGALFMLRAKNRQELRSGLTVGEPIDVDWVPIEKPEHGIDAEEDDIRGVQRQGLVQGASKFTRLEGIFVSDGDVFFTATNGGNEGCGQVFRYRPSEQQLTLIYESADRAVLDYPDNICVSPRGGMVICQDSKGDVQSLFGLTSTHELFEFARNNVLLDGATKGLSGDFRRSEWAGSCFTPDGKWLFANVFSPGFTVAITGPWGEGLV